MRAYIRTGNGAGYYQHFDNWPAPRNKIRQVVSGCLTLRLGRRRTALNDFLRLSQNRSSAEKSKELFSGRGYGEQLPLESRADTVLGDGPIFCDRPAAGGYGSRRLHETDAVGVLNQQRYGCACLVSRYADEKRSRS